MIRRLSLIISIVCTERYAIKLGNKQIYVHVYNDNGILLIRPETGFTDMDVFLQEPGIVPKKDHFYITLKKDPTLALTYYDKDHKFILDRFDHTENQFFFVERKPKQPSRIFFIKIKNRCMTYDEYNAAFKLNTCESNNPNQLFSFISISELEDFENLDRTTVDKKPNPISRVESPWIVKKLSRLRNKKHSMRNIWKSQAQLDSTFQKTIDQDSDCELSPFNIPLVVPNDPSYDFRSEEFQSLPTGCDFSRFGFKRSKATNNDICSDFLFDWCTIPPKNTSEILGKCYGRGDSINFDDVNTFSRFQSDKSRRTQNASNLFSDFLQQFNKIVVRRIDDNMASKDFQMARKILENPNFSASSFSNILGIENIKGFYGAPCQVRDNVLIMLQRIFKHQELCNLDDPESESIKAQVRSLSMCLMRIIAFLNRLYDRIGL